MRRCQGWRLAAGLVGVSAVAVAGVMVMVVDRDTADHSGRSGRDLASQKMLLPGHVPQRVTGPVRPVTTGIPRGIESCSTPSEARGD